MRTISGGWGVPLMRASGTPLKSSLTALVLQLASSPATPPADASHSAPFPHSRSELEGAQGPQAQRRRFTEQGTEASERAEGLPTIRGVLGGQGRHSRALSVRGEAWHKDSQIATPSRATPAGGFHEPHLLPSPWQAPSLQLPGRVNH